MKLFATAKMGLESVVADELRQLGAQDISVSDARVDFTGDMQLMTRSCLWLRAAERVLIEAASFKAVTFDELFEGVKAVDWRPYIARDTFIHVNGKSAKSALFSVSDCQSIAKKAIVESLRASRGVKELPESGREVIIEIGILRDVVTVAIDCCGAGLSRRGYRTYNVQAPIAETLGAGILLLSRYRGGVPLVDPMCGSGTFPIEAAMIANNIAPGAGRRFAFDEWHFLDPAIPAAAREEAADRKRNDRFDIYGSDIDERSIGLCKMHAKKAGVTVNWAVRPLSELTVTADRGLFVCNPPYGERMMEKKEAEALYRDMSRIFSQAPGWSTSVITSHPDFERIFGRKADKRRKLSNGGMPCTLFMYFKH